MAWASEPIYFCKLEFELEPFGCDKLVIPAIWLFGCDTVQHPADLTGCRSNQLAPIQAQGVGVMLCPSSVCILLLHHKPSSSEDSSKLKPSGTGHG
jgi:hypothetical protein